MVEFDMVRDESYTFYLSSIGIQNIQKSTQGLQPSPEITILENSEYRLRSQEREFTLTVNEKYIYLVENVYNSLSAKLCSMLEQDNSMGASVVVNHFCFKLETETS
jgi:hypothetical protein